MTHIRLKWSRPSSPSTDLRESQSAVSRNTELERRWLYSHFMTIRTLSKVDMMGTIKSDDFVTVDTSCDWYRTTTGIVNVDGHWCSLFLRHFLVNVKEPMHWILLQCSEWTPGQISQEYSSFTALQSYNCSVYIYGVNVNKFWRRAHPSEHFQSGMSVLYYNFREIESRCPARTSPRRENLDSSY